jgi:glycosyltransferase involved in cell wall biosynthesis
VISVVIPTLNEARSLESLVPSLAREREYVEIVVVAGGSRDGSADLARRLGARVLRAGRGRGPQLRAGAEASSGADQSTQWRTLRTIDHLGSVAFAPSPRIQ